MNIVDYHTALTVLFVAAFFAMVIWVFLPGRRDKYRDIAHQPLEEERRRQTHDKTPHNREHRDE